MPKYDLKEYSNNYSQATRSLWQHYKEEPALGALSTFDFPANDNSSTLFKLEIKIADRASNYGTKDVKLMVPLKYLGNFWETLEMLLN